MGGNRPKVLKELKNNDIINKERKIQRKGKLLNKVCGQLVLFIQWIRI